MPISTWPKSLRPREKLLTQGSSALSDAELLALLLRVGTRGKSALDLAYEIIQHFGSLSSLSQATASQLQNFSGIGPAKYVQLQAGLELAKRILKEKICEAPQFTSSADVKNWLQLSYAYLPYEVFMVILLDNQHRLLQIHELFKGTINHIQVHIREVVKLALHYNCSAMICVHNHPSGNEQPSIADRELTTKLIEALKLVDIQLLDHFIVTKGNQLYSFCEQGLL